MKLRMKVDVVPWHPPKQVHTEQGASLDIRQVPGAIIEHLCRKWLDSVASKTGMAYTLMMEHPEPTDIDSEAVVRPNGD